MFSRVLTLEEIVQSKNMQVQLVTAYDNNTLPRSCTVWPEIFEGSNFRDLIFADGRSRVVPPTISVGLRLLLHVRRGSNLVRTG